MPGTMIHNPFSAPVTLPFPFVGVLLPGQRIVAQATVTQLLELAPPLGACGLRLTELPTNYSGPYEIGDGADSGLYSITTAVPSTEGASIDDVMTLGNNGPEWRAPSTPARGLPDGGSAQQLIELDDSADPQWVDSGGPVERGTLSLLPQLGDFLLRDGSAVVASNAASDPAKTAARDAIGAAVKVAPASLLSGAITNGGLAHQLLVTLTVTNLLLNPLQNAPIEVWLYYSASIGGLAANTGKQVERILSNYPSGAAPDSARYYGTTNASGVLEILATFNATGGTLYVEARVRGIPSDPYIATQAIP